MTDADFMELALDQARAAASAGEVPVGAVVVHEGKVIATGRNALRSRHDPTAHAEMDALRAAAQSLGNYRLEACEMFVTLEPCAMCSGAILNARLKRVVFAAPEPKTGAAGSVVDLFSDTRLNHHTRWQGGLLAEVSRELMQQFFHQRRAEQSTLALMRHPLRDDALRTPNAAFDGLPDYPWEPHYRSDLPALDRLRIHYLDEKGGADVPQNLLSPATYLCLHGADGWSYSLRRLISSLTGSGKRVVVPDLVGFGKSDKPKKAALHTLERHHRILAELVEALDLENIMLVVSPTQSLLGLTLPLAAPARYRGMQLLDDESNFSGQAHGLGKGFKLWRQAVLDATGERGQWAEQLNHGRLGNPPDVGTEEPFPSPGFRMGPKAFQTMGWATDGAGSMGLVQRTGEFWSQLAVQ